MNMDAAKQLELRGNETNLPLRKALPGTEITSHGFRSPHSRTNRQKN